MKNDRILSLLGICRKAGKVQSGEFSAENTVKGGRAFLVILAGDASANTRKKFENMCSYYEVPCLVYGTKDMLGESIGADNRAVLSICDEGLAGSLIRLIGTVQTIDDKKDTSVSEEEK